MSVIVGYKNKKIMFSWKKNIDSLDASKNTIRKTRKCLNIIIETSVNCFTKTGWNLKK